MKLFCIGRNYTDHIKELENESPTDPVVFLKPDASILLKKQPFFIPQFSKDVHHEVEVLVKIKKIGRYIAKKSAPKKRVTFKPNLKQKVYFGKKLRPLTGRQ